MARRFVRSWFTGELEEVNDDSPGGRQIIAREAAANRPTKHGGAYDVGWTSKTLSVPIEQMAEFNENAQRNGTGAVYIPRKDGSPYADVHCGSRDVRKRELLARNKIDFDGGYGDPT